MGGGGDRVGRGNQGINGEREVTLVLIEGKEAKGLKPVSHY